MPHHQASYTKVTQTNSAGITYCFICDFYNVTIEWGKVVPASKLAQLKEQGLERIRVFEAASEDEGRHRRTAKPAPQDKLESLPLVRERFEE